MNPRQLLVGAAALAVVAFVALAATRRLNFDEALALRAGVLELGGADVAPPFVMPFTLALGALASAVSDPGDLFVAARLLTALALLAALAAALRALGLVGARWALAVLLTLAQAAFVVHALEFRYDAAIALALLGLAIGVGDPCRPRPFLAGLAWSLLALHHVKGLVLAAALLPFLVARLRGVPGALRRSVGTALLAGGLWCALLGALGLFGRWLATLRGFAALAGATSRVAAGEALGATLLRDLAWWLVVLAALAVALRARIRSSEAEEGETAALVLGCVALSIVLLHPHPWAYMLALPAPFLAAVVARRLPATAAPRRVRLTWAALVLLALALQAIAAPASVASVWRAGFAAPMTAEVETLRELRRISRGDDAVLDPSGLVYFLPPCTREWYVDTLFAELAARGRWLTELAEGVPAHCVWALDTYRLGALPAAARAELARDFRLFSSGIAIRRADVRAEALDLPTTPRGRPIESFW